MPVSSSRVSSPEGNVEREAARVQNSRWSWQGRLSCLFAACFRGSCALNRSCGPIWRAHEETETRKVKSGADDARPFYTTRSYWLQKQRVLFSDLLDRVKKTGDPELSEAISEARRCTRQISSEWVRQNPHYLQVVKERFDAVCTRLFEAARNDVPGGEALLDDIAECDRVLMAPKFSVWEYENPYLRPEHEVDLSFIAIPSDQGDTSQSAGSSESQTTARDSAESGQEYHLAESEVMESRPLISRLTPLSADH